MINYKSQFDVNKYKYLLNFKTILSHLEEESTISNLDEYYQMLKFFKKDIDVFFDSINKNEMFVYILWDIKAQHISFSFKEKPYEEKYVAYVYNFGKLKTFQNLSTKFFENKITEGDFINSVINLYQKKIISKQNSTFNKTNKKSILSKQIEVSDMSDRDIDDLGQDVNLLVKNANYEELFFLNSIKNFNFSPNNLFTISYAKKYPVVSIEYILFYIKCYNEKVDVFGIQNGSKALFLFPMSLAESLTETNYSPTELLEVSKIIKEFYENKQNEFKEYFQSFIYEALSKAKSEIVASAFYEIKNNLFPAFINDVHYFKLPAEFDFENSYSYNHETVYLQDFLYSNYRIYENFKKLITDKSKNQSVLENLIIFLDNINQIYLSKAQFLVIKQLISENCRNVDYSKFNIRKIRFFDNNKMLKKELDDKEMSAI